MAGHIHVMPEWLRNQIAAGEVVERPASVVKELVENALDAGATRVTVEFEQGGKKRLRVADNGHGMSREDAVMSVERHATSKLLTLEDLRQIRSFGFRGEALPSIASVSRFTLRTRAAKDPVGTEVAFDGGTEKRVADAAMAVGTEVVVEELFARVPVRRKFLKKDATEAEAIVECVQRVALCNHAVHFELAGDGRTLLAAPAETGLLPRIYSILGRKTCEHLYECFLDGPVTVRGFISDPEWKKRGTASLFTYVNGRFVRDKIIMQAIASGYSTLLARGEYPVAVLDVELPPEQVDVNVHPTKAEVRFERANEVFAAVSRAVKLTLADTPWVKEQMGAEGSPSPAPTSPERATRAWPSDLGFVVAPSPVRGEGIAEVEGRGGDSPPSVPRSPGSLGTPPPIGGGRDAAMQGPAPSFASVSYLGQYANCFLLGQLGRKLVVIDQHAAHERVLFEKYRQEFDQRKVAMQPLLVPVLMELTPALVAAVEAGKEMFERLGFAVEPFGGHTVAVKGVPVLLRQRPPEPVVAALLAELSDASEATLSTLFHKTLSTLACHSAVRAGDPMRPEEVTQLLRLMDTVDLSAYCPHGRPVVAFVEEGEVARWFKRT